MSRKKIILLIIVIIIVVVLISTLVFYFIFKKKPKEVIEEKPKAEILFSSSGFEFYEEEGRKKEFVRPSVYIDEPVDSPILSLDKKHIFYFSKKTREIIDYSIAENKKRTIFKIEFEPHEILWSPRKDKAMIRSKEGYYLFDLLNKTIHQLSKNIYYISWSPSGNKIAYQYLSALAEKNFISISDPDGSNWRNIVDFSESKDFETGILTTWSLDEKSIFYSFEASDVSDSAYYKVDLETGTKTDLSDWGYLVDFRFLPKSKKILFTIFKEEIEIPELWIMNKDGSNRQYVGIDSFVCKCVWKNDEKTAICAISEDVHSYRSNDILIQVDLKTKEKKQITGIVENQPINVRDLFLSLDEKDLFFVNNIDGKLYKLSLE